MEELALQQPVLVGREKELDQLMQSLTNALAGRGSTTFVAGEAGIGKTRLVSELIKDAEAKGCRTTRSWCLAESLEPLMPVKLALREAGLMHIMSGEPPPLVVSAYLMNDAGMLIAKAERERQEMDPDIFAGMLQAVGRFVQDSLAQMDSGAKGELNSLGYADYTILIRSAGKLSLAVVIKGDKSEFLIEDMKGALAHFGNAFDRWDGNMASAKSAEAKVSWFVSSGKYDGMFLVDDPKLKQENLFDNILLGIQRASAERPLLLFLDDLQWADPMTLNLLHYLARNTRKNRVMVLGTYRPEDMLKSPEGKPHHLETAMQNMSREDLFSKIDLKRLGPEDTGRVMNSILGKTSFEKGFFEKVHVETGGTPFFILEVVKLLAEEGIISHEAGTWKLVKGLEKFDIPSKVYDVVKRRLDRLMAEQREMLEYAAVIGEEFSTEVLGRAAEIRKITLLKNLSEIEKAHNLIHYLKDKYRFDHAKIREVLYNGIGEELRSEYHRIIGDTIAGLFRGNIDDAAPELAYHYCEAGDTRAGEYLVKAGDRAKEKYANDDAIKAYQKALGFIAEDGQPDILEKLGDVLALTGDYDGAVVNFEAACNAAKGGEAKARTLRKISEVHDIRGEFGKSLELLAKAKALAEEGSAEHARVTHAEGTIHWRMGELDKGLAIIKTALRELEESEGKQMDIGNVLRAMGSIHLSKGEFDDALRNYEKSLEVMEGISELRGIAAALNNMGIVYHRKGEQDKALDFYGRSLMLVEKIGYKQNMATTLNNIGNVYLNKGRPEKALEFYERSLPMVEKMGDRGGIAMSLNNMGIVYHWRGETGKALEFFGRSLAIKEGMGDKRGVSTSLDGIGLVYYDMGELEKALDYHERSLKISLEIGFRRETADNYCGLAETNHDLGNIEAALENAEKAIAVALEIKSKVHEGIGHRVLGMAYRAKNELARAEEEFEKAAKILGEIDEKRELVRLFYEHSLLSKAKGDKNRQKELLEGALSDAALIGMTLWVNKCRKALAEI